MPRRSTGQIPSDAKVTVEMAKRVLAVARDEVGLDGYSWFVANGTATREKTWKLIAGWFDDREDEKELIGPMAAMRIREEFGVDGLKPARPKPYKPRKRKLEAWPDA